MSCIKVRFAGFGLRDSSCQILNQLCVTISFKGEIQGGHRGNIHLLLDVFNNNEKKIIP